MGLIPTKSPGDRLKADEVNTLSTSAQSIANLRAGPSIRIRNVTNPILKARFPFVERQDAPEFIDGLAFVAGRPIPNIPAIGYVPKFAVALVMSKSGTNPTFERPSQSGFAAIAIAHTKLSDPEGGWARFSGVGLVAYNQKANSAGYTDGIGTGNRLGCRKNSWFAQWDSLGPLHVIGPYHSGAARSTMEEGLLTAAGWFEIYPDDDNHYMRLSIVRIGSMDRGGCIVVGDAMMPGGSGNTYRQPCYVLVFENESWNVGTYRHGTRATGVIRLSKSS